MVIVTEYLCQFCGKPSPCGEWLAQADHCPKCGKAFDLEALGIAPRRKDYAFDPACGDLARSFMAERLDASEEDIKGLAQYIQDAAEGWIEDWDAK
jgi:hypothetical protein